jgi:predicted acylesterase/phospholipase RssA
MLEHSSELPAFREGADLAAAPPKKPSNDAGASPDLNAIKILTAAEVIEAEHRLLFDAETRASSDVLGVGLAFSGGGIRSASFGLGVFQALLSTPFFKKVDYLSTVSGGGYLGGAISWLRKLSANQYSDPDQAYTAFEKEFGSAVIGMRSGDDAGKSRSMDPSAPTLKATPMKAPDADKDRKYVWLDYIRSHGNYLLPPGISYLGVGLTVLRGTLFNLSVYGGLLTCLFALLIILGVIPGPDDSTPWAMQPWFCIQSWLFLGGVLFAGSVLLYGIATWLASTSVAFSIVSGVAFTGGFAWLFWQLSSADRTEQLFGATPFDNARWPLTAAAAIVAAVVGFLTSYGMWADKKNQYGRPNETWHYQSRIAYTDHLGTFCGLLITVLVVWSLPLVYKALVASVAKAVAAATFSSVLGALGGVYQFVQGRGKSTTTSAWANVRLLGSAVLLIYGLGFLSYVAAANLADGEHGALLEVILISAVVIGFFVNTNYLGLSRMYRDRIMEAFMPNAASIKANRWGPATEADATALVDLRTKEGGILRPLHLINCNAVMIDSANDRFRGRGGDSFVLSPQYSGSDATGWVKTENLGDGQLSLATAVATSGAAANPNAAVAGLGVTRNRLVSFLMSILNIRLGYWIPNPNNRCTWLRKFWPNLWTPGLRQGLFGRGLSEKAIFVELTDGGHFENTALYELIRRRVRLIVAVEAGQDDGCKLDDLANAIERARVDFGVHIRFDEADWNLNFLQSDEKTQLASRGFAIGSIRYPEIPQPDPENATYIDGVILYIQAIPVSDMRPDTQSYWRRHTDFPNEPTSNQFFEEEQLEAYREVGLRIGRAAVATIHDGSTRSFPSLVALRGVMQVKTTISSVVEGPG